MIVGYGDNNVLLIGLVKSQLEELERDRSLTYEPPPGFTHRHGTILIVYAETREKLIEQLRAAGVAVAEHLEASYLAGQRTDRPRRPF